MLQSSCAVCWLCGLRRVTQLLWTLALNGVVVVGGAEWIAKKRSRSCTRHLLWPSPSCPSQRMPVSPPSQNLGLDTSHRILGQHIPTDTHTHTTEDKTKLQKVSSECVL